MPFSDIYRSQVRLLIRALPYVSDEDCFALKGGTAINLFIRDMPRLSVDIDLTYLPVADRDQSLKEIGAALKRIAGRIKKAMPRVTITESAPGTQQTINKIVVRTPDRVQIKIEVTPVLRGCVYEPEWMTISAQVEDEYGSAEIKVLSFADLFAGKIMAALDRQHPRDLFDVHHLLANEGISEELRTAVIIYLISHDHPPHSLLSPAFRDISHDFEHNFRGMTDNEVEQETLEQARKRLATDILTNMPEHHKRFLLTFYRREPDWELLGLQGLDQLPSVRWRELNLDKAGKGTQEEIVHQLEKLLWHE